MKVLKVFCGLFVLLLLTVLLHSCCEEEGRYTGEGGLTAYYSNQHSDLDTVSKAFYLKVAFDYEVKQVGLENFNIVSTAYATSCGFERINIIEQESIELKLSEPFVYDGDTIDSEYNLLKLSSIQEEMDAHQYNLHIHITDEFLENASIGDDEYIFNFTSNTSDGLQLSFEKKLWIIN